MMQFLLFDKSLATLWHVPHFQKYCRLSKQEGHEALNRLPEYAGQRSNII